ncbi:hypothetical protein HZA99_05145 [Candidatus Woesearchaeota archaeon]|nr:hypothetical protein [Candidatus Woesearchaeota archaeon]
MKIIKTYKLSEQNLEKDIDQFIRNAKTGEYQYDYKYGMEGLKLIKAYFRMIEEEYKKQNYQIARACYKKMMFLLLQSEYNYFNYEDIVGKLNFEKFLANYFICLIKQCNVEELFMEYLEYLKIKEDYYFESVHETIFANLGGESLAFFVNLVEKKAETIKEEDYAMHDLIYFLIDLAKSKKDKAGIDQLCSKYPQIVDEDEPFEV